MSEKILTEIKKQTHIPKKQNNLYTDVNVYKANQIKQLQSLALVSIKLNGTILRRFIT